MRSNLDGKIKNIMNIRVKEVLKLLNL